MGKRAGGRQRLKTFLIENREAATDLIQEMHDARNILSNDVTLKIDELYQACFLRDEYFGEVPETVALSFNCQQSPGRSCLQSGAVMLQNIGAHISLIKINDNRELGTAIRQNR